MNLVDLGRWTFGGRNKNLVGRVYWVNFSRWEGWVIFGFHPLVEKTMLSPLKKMKNYKPPIWLSPLRGRRKCNVPKSPIKLSLHLPRGRFHVNILLTPPPRVFNGGWGRGAFSKLIKGWWKKGGYFIKKRVVCHKHNTFCVVIFVDFFKLWMPCLKNNNNNNKNSFWQYSIVFMFV